MKPSNFYLLFLFFYIVVNISLYDMHRTRKSVILASHFSGSTYHKYFKLGHINSRCV